MTSLQTPQAASPPDRSLLENGSPIKNVVAQSQSSLGEYLAAQVDDSTNGGPSQRRDATGATASSKDKQSQKRLSQVVPQRPKGKELVNEEEPWDAKNVLSLDGGGIRGLYSLFILRQLMNTIKMVEETFSDGEGKISPAWSSFHPSVEPFNVSHVQPPSQDEDEQHGPKGHYLPCHYFDFICGTSTGGLIAIMLSRLRMTVDDCILEYENLVGRVFGHPRLFHQTSIPTFWLKRPKYDAANLEAVISGSGGVTQRRGEIAPDQDRTAFETGVRTCKTFVFAYRQEGAEQRVTFDVPYIFRSYDRFQRGPNGSPVAVYPRNPGGASKFPIWKVARATTAAPLYFEPMRIVVDGDTPQPKGTILSRITTTLGADPNPGHEATRPSMTFIDGGFGEANNPSKEAFYEVTLSNKTISTFVSIGTGREVPNKFSRGLRRLIQTSFAAVGDPEVAHQFMSDQSKQLGFQYFRLNEPGGLPDMAFDEWKPRNSGERTKQKIRDAFHNWFAEHPEVAADLHKCALELVRRRRLRTADESHWERYALGAYFDCQEDNCPDAGSKRWYNRNDFQSHLMNDHKMEEGVDLQNALNSHRRIWRYKPRNNGGLA